MICNINVEKNNKELLMNHQKNALCCQTLKRVSNKTVLLMLALLRRRIKKGITKALYALFCFLRH